ncbi:MAG: hypothetical protein ACRDP6_32315 [Actinoallomurus sp.]
MNTAPTPALLAAVRTALTALTGQDHRAASTLSLIPSENTCSALARMPLATDATHRYFFNTSGDPDGWAFPAGRTASAVETGLTLPLLRELTGAHHINIRALSGLHAMSLVLSAWAGRPGTALISIHPDQGGHYATASLAARFGLTPHQVGGPNPHTIDLDALTALVRTHRPRLVYLDQAHVLFPADITATAAAVRAGCPQTLVYADASHTMGLILGRALPNPLTAGADAFGGSTHKTFPGPQKGMICTDHDDLAELLGQAQYEMVSNHHLGAACALGLAAAEFIAADAPDYAAQTITAAQALGAALADHGLQPQAAEHGYTATHQLWLDTTRAGVPGTHAGHRLYEAGFHVNVLTDLPGLAGRSALRLGTAEAVACGLNATDMPQVAALLTDAILARRPAHAIAGDVAELRANRTSRWQLHRHPYLADLLSNQAVEAIA